MAHDGASVAPPSVDVSQRDDPRVLVLRQLDDLRHKLSALSVADKPVQKDSRCAGSHHHDQDDSFRGLGHPLACRRFFSHAAPPPDPPVRQRGSWRRAYRRAGCSSGAPQRTPAGVSGSGATPTYCVGWGTGGRCAVVTWPTLTAPSVATYRDQRRHVSGSRHVRHRPGLDDAFPAVAVGLPDDLAVRFHGGQRRAGVVQAVPRLLDGAAVGCCFLRGTAGR